MWVLDYVDDVESDLSAFHRVDDPLSMHGPRFFRYALRLGAYQGVIAARLAEEQEKTNKAAGAQPGEQVSHVPDDVLLSQHADLFTDKAS